jgi:hypothetical protein
MKLTIITGKGIIGNAVELTTDDMRVLRNHAEAVKSDVEKDLKMVVSEATITRLQKTKDLAQFVLNITEGVSSVVEVAEKLFKPAEKRHKETKSWE